MKNNKGFVVSAVLYPLLILFLSLIMGLISMSSTRKNILDNMKMEISDSIFDSVTCDCEVINSTLKKYGQSIKKIENDITAIENDINTINTTQNTLSTNLTNLTNRVTSLETNVNSLKSRMSTAESKITNIETNYATKTTTTLLDNKITTLTTTVNNLNTSLTSLTNRVAALEAGIVYKDPVLNGATPVLYSGLVPLNMNYYPSVSSGSYTVANIYTEWYNYSNGNYAKACLSTSTAKAGSSIYCSNDNIYVWIPRYRYKIFNTGSYTSTSGTYDSSKSKKQEIEIIFETRLDEASTGTSKDSWRTHPAFTSFDVDGIWVQYGKTTLSKDGTISNAFTTAYNYKRSFDSHMMKNTEYGAVIYLIYSKYSSSSAKSNLFNNQEIYVAAHKSGKLGESGFTTAPATTYGDKYVDVYSSDSGAKTYNKRKLGDATGELGPFYGTGTTQVSSWVNDDYNDSSAYFVENSWPWFKRNHQFEFASANGKCHGYSSGSNNCLAGYKIVFAVK